MTLVEALQITLRRLHYSPRTEESYLHWMRAFAGQQARSQNHT